MDALVNYGSDDESSDKYMENKGRMNDDPKTAVKPQGDSADDVNYDNVQMDMSEESDAGQRQKGRDARRSSSSSSSPNSSSEEEDEPPRSKHRVSLGSSHHLKKSKESSDKDGGGYSTERHRKREESRRSPGHKESSKHRRKERSSRRSRSRSRDRGGRSKESKERDKDKRRRGSSREKDGDRESSRRKSGREGSGKRSRSRERARDRHHSDRKRSRSRSPHHHRHHHGHHDDDRRSKRSRGRSPSKAQSALLEGLGLQVEGSVTKSTVTNIPTSLITPQLLVQRSLEVQATQVHNTTGIQFPSYYNPAAMNPLKYAEQMQKRKKLWSGNKDTAKDTSTSGTSGGSTNNWESTTFAQDQDGKLSAKFKRLMGIKTAGSANNAAPAQPEGSSQSSEDVIKKQEELFSTMERQYEAARLATHTLRGVGLGFGSSSAYQYPR